MQKVIVYLSMLYLAAFITACGGPKKIATTAEQPVKGMKVYLSEEKKMEFEYLFVEGLKQKMIGNLDAARQYFNGCLEINPESAAVLYELANIDVQKNDFQGAKLRLEKAIQINNENKWYKLLLAQIYQREQNYLKASEIYRSLIAKEPDNVDYYYLNALLLTSAEKYDEAIKAYNQLEKVMGFNPQVALARHQVYRQANMKKESYAELERLITRDPNVPEYYGVMADMYNEDGNKAKALEYYNKVLELDPQNGFVQFSLANFYTQNNDLEAAFKHASIGFSDPELDLETKIQLYMMLVMVPSDKKLSTDQMDQLTQVISDTHPGDSKSFAVRADFLIQTGKKLEARDFIAKAVEKEPGNYGLWEQLVQLDHELGDYQQMVADANEALQLFPNQPLLYLLKAVAHIQLKEYKNSLEILDEGQVYVIDNPRLETQFEIYKAESFYNLNDSEHAFKAFERVLELDPNNFMAMNNYAYYLSLKGERLDRAEALSSQVVKANPDNPTYVDTHAWVLFKKKEYRLAKFYMETALKNGGSQNDVIVEHYGDILFMMGDVQGAIENWKKALELGSESEILKRKIADKKYYEGEE